MPPGSRPASPSRRQLLVLGATLLGAGVVGVTAAAQDGEGKTGPKAVGSHSPSAAPSSASPAPTGPVNPGRILIAGDSTASVYARAEVPWAGWGQALPLFLPSTTVIDEALPGSSSMSYYQAGRLDHLLAQASADDILLIGFGHNDELPDPARHTEPYGSYQEYLRKFVDAARLRGVRPVLVTPPERRSFDGKRALSTHGQYPAAMRALARAEDVPLIDLTAATLRLWQRLGPEGTKNYFLWLRPGQWRSHPKGIQDPTHFQVRGAIALARLVATALSSQSLVVPGVVANLKRTGFDWPDLAWPAKRPADQISDSSPSPLP